MGGVRAKRGPDVITLDGDVRYDFKQEFDVDSSFKQDLSFAIEARAHSQRPRPAPRRAKGVRGNHYAAARRTFSAAG